MLFITQAPLCHPQGRGGEGNYSRQFAATSGTSCNHTALSGNGGGSSLPDLHLHCHAVPLSSERNLPQPLPPFITRRFFTNTMLTQLSSPDSFIEIFAFAIFATRLLHHYHVDINHHQSHSLSSSLCHPSPPVILRH